MLRNLLRRASPTKLIGRGAAFLSVATAFVSLALVQSGCPSTTCETDAGTVEDAGPAGGAVMGAYDTHCTSASTGGPDVVVVADPADAGAVYGTYYVQQTLASVCSFTPPNYDAGCGLTGEPSCPPEYGTTMYNQEGCDDDCKYHVAWASTPIIQNQNVWFTVSAFKLADLSAMNSPSMYVEAEVYLSSTHPAPNSGQTTTNPFPGTYVIGPVVFDAPGQWTVRFHWNENCVDILPDSPHGHSAFYVNVP
jgi:hypothetical protein